MLSVLRLGCFSPHVDSCSFLLSFYGFLSSAEITTSSNLFHPANNIAFFLDLNLHPNFFSLFLKHSTAGGVCSVNIAHIESQFYPFKSMCKYFRNRPLSDFGTVFFLTPDNNPLTKYWLSYHLEENLVRLTFLKQSSKISKALRSSNKQSHMTGGRLFGVLFTYLFSSNPSLPALRSLLTSFQTNHFIAEFQVLTMNE